MKNMDHKWFLNDTAYNALHSILDKLHKILFILIFRSLKYYRQALNFLPDIVKQQQQKKECFYSVLSVFVFWRRRWWRCKSGSSTKAILKKSNEHIMRVSEPTSRISVWYFTKHNDDKHEKKCATKDRITREKKSTWQTGKSVYVCVNFFSLHSPRFRITPKKINQITKFHFLVTLWPNRSPHHHLQSSDMFTFPKSKHTQQLVFGLISSDGWISIYYMCVFSLSIISHRLTHFECFLARYYYCDLLDKCISVLAVCWTNTTLFR